MGHCWGKRIRLVTNSSHIVLKGHTDILLRTSELDQGTNMT